MDEVIILRKLFFLSCCLLILSACVPNKKVDFDPASPLPPAEAKVQKSDFIYKLSTEKDVYDTFGETAIFAELTYVGEMDSIDIYHAASPFYFPLEERTHGIEIDYPMNEPLIMTTLKKDESLRQKYNFAGGYSDQDEATYVEFVKMLMNEGFPEGEYIIHGSAEFKTTALPEATDDKSFNLKADIGFTVVEPFSR
ncbi:hypothetical protein [Sporosarcina sp. NPDC096371]|uniref:hypothetical protein n=1 Tax=Sporosarcina sp. NPDC096371 TaxID=3364530 RepID=UPI00380C04F8